jgi:DNA-binding transcriptional LysR family regulator
MSLSLRGMRYFRAVGELGSISAAVQSLNVSQSAITESIQALESHLGALLFRRHARGMTLTHAGHEFLRHTERILNAVAGAEEALSVRPEALAGQVVIGAVPLLTGYYLPALLARYRRAFPNVRSWVYEADKRRAGCGADDDLDARERQQLCNHDPGTFAMVPMGAVATSAGSSHCGVCRGFAR